MISIVVTARNDDYGDNFLGRMQIFIDCLFEQIESAKSKWELIVVEWNPLPEKSSLETAIRWPNAAKGNVRIITVPKDIHETLPASDTIPVFEYPGKNVGMRRAQGDFVMITNPDIVFSDPLFQYLDDGNLDTNAFYRVNRCDVFQMPEDDASSPKEIRKHCEENFSRVNDFGGTYELTLPPLSETGKVEYQKLRLAQEKERLQNTTRVENQLFMNAAGDFFLMAQEYWHKAQGYPQLKSFTFIDSLMCYQAKAMGLTQVALDHEMCIYHQEHDRSQRAGRASIPLQEFFDAGQKILESGDPAQFNDDNWGLGSFKLKETQL